MATNLSPYSHRLAWRAAHSQRCSLKISEHLFGIAVAGQRRAEYAKNVWRRLCLRSQFGRVLRAPADGGPDALVLARRKRHRWRFRR